MYFYLHTQLLSRESPLMHVFIHPVKYLLSSYYAPGVVLGTGAAIGSKKRFQLGFKGHNEPHPCAQSSEWLHLETQVLAAHQNSCSLSMGWKL